MSSKFGGKRPRNFRNAPGPSNFNIVNFLDEDGNKTDDQEIVPTLWIIHGKKPMCHFPKDPNITKRELEKLVREEAPPSMAKFSPYYIRILQEGLTLEEAKERFEALAESSGADKSKQNVKKGTKSNQRNDNKDSDASSKSADGDDDSETDSFDSANNKRAPQAVKGKGAGSRNRTNSNESFQFNTSPRHGNVSPDLFASEVNRRNTNSSIPGNRSVLTNNSCSSQVSKPVQGSSIHQCVSKEEFDAFQKKLFTKLNSIWENIQQLHGACAKGKQLIAFPESISKHCITPAADVETLEKLDDLLSNEAVKTEIASYLTQLGGKSYKEFLTRAVPILVSDEVCYLTNWSGSAVPPGSKDAAGHEITRDFKKTFSNLLNIIDMFFVAAHLVDITATKSSVEKYLKNWLLHFKDRMQPRSHEAKAANTNRSPRKKKTSPKKKSK